MTKISLEDMQARAEKFRSLTDDELEALRIETKAAVRGMNLQEQLVELGPVHIEKARRRRLEKEGF